jgi:hypothetical protein
MVDSYTFFGRSTIKRPASAHEEHALPNGASCGEELIVDPSCLAEAR